jgi:hypothetical protein
MADIHVVPDGDRWKVERAGGESIDSFPTQAEAIAVGREAAEAEQGELVIHGADGRIREKDSHGHDPRDVPG